MPSNWEHIKKSVKYELSDAMDTTKKFFKIGKEKLEIINNNNALKDTFQELGIKVYDQVTRKNKWDIRHNPEVKSLIEKVNQIKQLIKDEKEEIEVLNKQPAAQTLADANSAVPHNDKARKNV